MKKIKRTKIVIRHSEAFTASTENFAAEHFDVCPRCHSVLAQAREKQIHSNMTLGLPGGCETIIVNNEEK